VSLHFHLNEIHLKPPPHGGPLFQSHLGARDPDAEDDRSLRSQSFIPLIVIGYICVVGATSLAFRQNVRDDRTLPFTTHTGAWRLFRAYRLRCKILPLRKCLRTSAVGQMTEEVPFGYQLVLILKHNAKHLPPVRT
jgi:hypothetical protein